MRFLKLFPAAAAALSLLPAGPARAGVTNPDISAIGQVLGNPSAYDDWSRRALGHASGSDFAPRELARRFLAACSAPPPKKAARAGLLDAARDQLQKIPVLDRILRRAFR